jgi:hypothetical protein
MEEGQPFPMRRQRDVHHIGDRAVAPADFLRVFRGGVLGVVDDQVCSAEKLDVPTILMVHWQCPCGGLAGLLRLRAGMGLVIRGIH